MLSKCKAQTTLQKPLGLSRHQRTTRDSLRSQRIHSGSGRLAALCERCTVHTCSRAHMHTCTLLGEERTRHKHLPAVTFQCRYIPEPVVSGVAQPISAGRPFLSVWARPLRTAVKGRGRGGEGMTLSASAGSRQVAAVSCRDR